MIPDWAIELLRTLENNRRPLTTALFVIFGLNGLARQISLYLSSVKSNEMDVTKLLPQPAIFDASPNLGLLIFEGIPMTFDDFERFCWFAAIIVVAHLLFLFDHDDDEDDEDDDDF